MEADALAVHLHGRPRLAVISLVSFKTGGAVDLPAVSRAARAAGVPLFLDATQGLGVVPFDAALADFVAASCFKWLLGAHGAAVLYVNPETAGDLRPAQVGWRSVPDLFARPRELPLDLHADARRFEDGMPPFPALYALECGLAVLSGFAADALAAHARALGGRLLDGLDNLGWPALTPRDPSARAGIVAMVDQACEEHARRLRRAGIAVWGRDGRLRASAHLYNDEADVDRLLDGLAALGRAPARRRSA